MGKYKFIANVDLKRGNVLTSEKMSFIADEDVFSPHFDLKKLNSIALKYIKKQNKERIAEYEKATVRGFSKQSKASTNSNYTPRKKYKSNSNIGKYSFSRMIVKVMVFVYSIFKKSKY